MRMIFIHGIGQEGKSSQKIHDDWLRYLREVYAKYGPDPLSKLSRIDAPFYGDRLAELSSVEVRGEAIALGAAKVPGAFDEFAVDALKEMALRMGATEEQIDAEESRTAVGMGDGIHKKSLKVIARVIETISPFHGTIALRVLGQAFAYIRNVEAHDEVNKIVRPLFEINEPAIIVSHSLGTIVAYSLLREFARDGKPFQSPLLVTLGSPLGVDSVRKGFQKPRGKPVNVVRWVNGADPEDFVALRSELTADNFGPGIDENYSNIENGDENPHSIEGYLSDPRIAKAIAESIP